VKTSRKILVAAAAALMALPFIGTARAETTPTATPTAGDPLPLVNPGFEQPDLQGWRACIGDPANIQQVAGAGVDGSTALRLVDPARDTAVGACSDAFAVEAGTRYTVTAQTRAEATGNQIMLYFRWLDANGAQISQNDSGGLDVSQVWTRNGFSATAPEGAVKAYVLLYSSTYAINDVLWDDVLVSTAGPMWEATEVATPVTVLSSLRSAFGSSSPSGLPFTAVVKTGEPAELSIANLVTGKVTEHPLPGSQGSWGVHVSADGTTYVGTYGQGRFYRLKPGGQIEEFGPAIPGESFIWNLAEGPDGKIWGGTYPNARVFSFDPKTDEFTRYPQLAEGARYVRGIAVDDDGMVYAGTGANGAQVIKLDPETGATSTIPLPAEYAAERTVYDLDFSAGVLVARVEETRTLLVHKDGQWHPIGEGGGLEVSPTDPTDDSVFYYRGGAPGHLMKFDVDTMEVTDTGVQLHSSARGAGWVNTPRYCKDPALALGSYDAVTSLYCPATGKLSKVTHDLTPLPTPLGAIGEGPDGRIYASSMQSGGLAAVDLDTGEVQAYPSGTVGQVESFATVGDQLYFATYPGALHYRFNPARPFNFGSNPVNYMKRTEAGQDRPMTNALVGNILAYGNVPTYAQLGGEVTLVDTRDQSHRAVIPVPDQSVITLAAVGDLLVGGTSIYGGLGIEPTAKEAELFIMDPVSGEVLWRGVPLPGERVISSVSLAPDGTIWGLTAGKLFQFDPQTREVLQVVVLAPFNWASFVSLWSVGDVIAEADRITVVARDKVYEVDPVTLQSNLVYDGVGSQMIQTSDGSFLVKDRHRLLELHPSS
jgi:streptogramin lyase